MARPSRDNLIDAVDDFGRSRCADVVERATEAAVPEVFAAQEAFVAEEPVVAAPAAAAPAPAAAAPAAAAPEATPAAPKKGGAPSRRRRAPRPRLLRRPRRLPPAPVPARPAPAPPPPLRWRRRPPRPRRRPSRPRRPKSTLPSTPPRPPQRRSRRRARPPAGGEEEEDAVRREIAHERRVARSRRWAGKLVSVTTRYAVAARSSCCEKTPSPPRNNDIRSVTEPAGASHFGRVVRRRLGGLGAEGGVVSPMGGPERPSRARARPRGLGAACR